VGEIQTFTEPRHWLHVPGVVNPADIGTRPISITELRDCQAWWQGPEFLRSDVTEWPKTKSVQELESKELKQTIFLMTDHLKKVDLDSFGQLHPRHFSVSRHFNGLGKCLIKWGHILKVKQLFTMKKEDRPIRQSKFLRHADVEDARVFLIKQSQLEFFGEEIATFGRNQRNQVKPHPEVQSIFGPKGSHEKSISAYKHPRSHLRKGSPGHPSSQIGLRQTCCRSCSRRASTSNWRSSHERSHPQRVRHQRHGNTLSSDSVSMHGMSKTEGNRQHSVDGSTSGSPTRHQTQAFRQCRSRLRRPIRNQNGQRQNQEESLRACSHLHGHKGSSPRNHRRHGHFTCH
jgi:hypothetical protein